MAWVARWAAVDPAAVVGQASPRVENGYGALGSNPLRFVDPDARCITAFECRLDQRLGTLRERKKSPARANGLCRLSAALLPTRA